MQKKKILQKCMQDCCEATGIMALALFHQTPRENPIKKYT